MSKGKKVKIAVLAAVVLAVLVATVLLWPRLSTLTAQDILNFTPSQPVAAALVLIGIFCVKTALMFIPMLVLYLAAGMMFPTGWAIVVVYLGLFCEMSLGYLFGRFMGMDGVRRLVAKRPKAGRSFQLVEKNEKTACFISKLIPLPVPLDLVNMFFGASAVSYPVFMVFSLLGLTATMIPCVVAGNALSDPLSPRFLVPLGISLGITLALFFGNMLISRRKNAAAAGKIVENENETQNRT